MEKKHLKGYLFVAIAGCMGHRRFCYKDGGGCIIANDCFRRSFLGSANITNLFTGKVSKV